jgi:PST family polysaccharide transporter
MTTDPASTSEFDPPEGSLRRSVGRGALVTALSQMVQMALHIASVLVLSRLLAPGDFGLVAMCAPVVAFLGMLQDFGLVQATVQRKGLQRAEVDFVFWVSVAVAASMALVLVAISPLVAAFFDEPRVGPLMAAMALPMLIGGSGAQPSAILNRRMQFGRLAIASIAGSSSSLAVTIGWALVHPSYWALLAGTLTGAVVGTTSTWILARWWPGWPRRVEGARKLLGFGAGITGFNIANFFARNLDNILIGRVWGSEQLGFYDRAYKLLLFPLSQIANPLSRVMVPALSRMTEEPDRYRHAFLRVLNLSLLLSLPGVAFAVGMAPTLIPFALGEQWRPSAPIFMALGFAGLLQPLNNPAGWLFISQGRSTEFMWWGLATAAFAITAFAAGLPWGALGVAVAYAISEYVKTPFLWRYIGRSGPVRATHVLTGTGPAVVAAHVSLGAVLLAHASLAAHGLAGLAAAALLSYATYGAVLSLGPVGRATIKEATGLLAQSLVRLRRAA